MTVFAHFVANAMAPDIVVMVSGRIDAEIANRTIFASTIESNIHVVHAVKGCQSDVTMVVFLLSVANAEVQGFAVMELQSLFAEIALQSAFAFIIKSNIRAVHAAEES